MQLEELPNPTPGPGEVLVRVEAAGVNFIDVYHRTGRYPIEPPIPLGLEGAGVVEAGDLPAGTRVAWANVRGSYATHVVAPVDRLVELPDDIDAATAAAAMLQGMTAHYLVHDSFALDAEHTCVIHAAAGGVGLLLCQLARRVGARSLGTVSTADKAARAKAAGLDEAILYTEVDFADEVMRLTDGAGADVVYDSVGKSTFDRSLACLRPRGTLVLFGQSSGDVPPFDPQILNQRGSLFLTRPSLTHHVATPEELRARATDVLSWISAGELSIAIDRQVPLADAPAAHRALESRQTSGKILLLP